VKGEGVKGEYGARAERYRGLRDSERRRSVLISRLRLAAFLSAAALLVWSLGGRATPALLMASAGLFGIFGALVVWHARVDERVEWYDALQTVNERAIARIERRWSDLPPGDAPPTLDIAQHPFAIDLDLFGRASLFQWLGPAATAAGGFTLARWLVEPAEKDAIVARQGAVVDLAQALDWRERFAAHGVLTGGASQPEIDRLLTWAEGPGSFRRRRILLGVTVVTIVASMWALFALWFTGRMDAPLWLIPQLAGIILSFALAERIQTEFDRAGSGQRALARYAQLFEHAAAGTFSAARLTSIRERLTAGGRSAPGSMRRLNRILGFAELRRGAAILHFPIQAITLWDFFVLFALDRWRRTTGPHVREWLTAVAELDALTQLAGVRHDNPDWVMPVIHTDAVVVAEAIAHPLLTADRRVANDVSVGPPGTILLITGSNMSGKSTLLRAIGLNVVLAEAGGCACASRLELPVVNLQTSARVQDSLELGLSYFMAALARLKAIVDAAERPQAGRVMLYLLDEILQGTNSVERGVAVRAVARHLLDAGSIGAMTTHDLALAGEEPLKSAARLVHFTETVDARGSMAFDYRLRSGLATSRNALRLMEMIGIPVKDSSASR
jgi:ABC-type multidrug transport system fused ATPase/permease subunit